MSRTFRNHSVNSADVNKCTGGCERADNALICLSDFDICPYALLSLTADFSRYFADGTDDTAARTVDFLDLELNFLLEKLAHLSVSRKTCL